jgi:hypothetical protein
MKTIKRAFVLQLAPWLWLAAQAQIAPVLVNYQSRLANRDSSERTRAKPQRGGLFIGSVCPAMYFLFFSDAAAGLLLLIGWMADWLVAHGEKPNTAPLKNKKGMLGWGGVSINRSPRWGLAAIVIFLVGVRLVGQAQTVPSLINYQGRLSNPDGSPLATTDYQLTFNIYDATNGGNLVWGPQIFDGTNGLGHGSKIPVVQGYFNVMLGPTDTRGTNLADSFNATNRFVEIKVGTNQPILPRQQILTAPFAFNSAKLAGADWSAVFGTNDPVNGKISGARLADGTVTSNQIALGTIVGSQIASNTVSLTNLAQRQVGPNVGAGGLAMSLPIARQHLTSTSFQDITNLTVTIQTTGRPVIAFLVSALLDNTNSPSGLDDSFLHFVPNSGANNGQFRLMRDGGAAAIIATFGTGAGGAGAVGYPAPMGPLIDLPGPGTHTYKLQWGFVPGGGSVYADIYNVRLVAWEL